MIARRRSILQGVLGALLAPAITTRASAHQVTLATPPAPVQCVTPRWAMYVGDQAHSHAIPLSAHSHSINDPGHSHGGIALAPCYGQIMGFLGEPPAGWILCDGSNGTPDMRNTIGNQA